LARSKTPASIRVGPPIGRHFGKRLKERPRAEPNNYFTKAAPSPARIPLPFPSGDSRKTVWRLSRARPVLLTVPVPASHQPFLKLAATAEPHVGVQHYRRLFQSGKKASPHQSS